MRLINTRNLSLHDFPYGEVPPYAILSHTWHAEEVTYQDMVSGEARSKRGMTKVSRTCEVALEQGLEFAWIDTCCIDKTSSAELTEAINSMFQWYKASVVCYVALEDLEPDAPFEKLQDCRWVTRGWTLQELIAPARVEFYDAAWTHRGSKQDHLGAVSLSTGLPRDIVAGSAELSKYSTAARMSWVAPRETSRTEDIAYCMLGIFGINMPLLYGEGPMAFRRLQEEILRRDNDFTILAWDRPHRQLTSDELDGVLAPSPSHFRACGAVFRFHDISDAIAVTNKGLLISGHVTIRVALCLRKGEQHYMFSVGYDEDRGENVKTILLRKISPDVFLRLNTEYLQVSTTVDEGGRSERWEDLGMLGSSDFYLPTDPKDIIAQGARHRRWAIHLPHDPNLELEAAFPQRLWDVTDRVFLRSKPFSFPYRTYEVLCLAVSYRVHGTTLRLVVLCNYEQASPTCQLHLLDRCPRILVNALYKPAKMHSVQWDQLDDVSGFPNGQQDITVTVGGRDVRIYSVLDKVPQASMSLLPPLDMSVVSDSDLYWYAVRLECEELNTIVLERDDES